jgi:hypothetical protein
LKAKIPGLSPHIARRSSHRAQAAADFRFQLKLNRRDQTIGDVFQIMGGNRFVRKKAREQQL